MWINIKIYVYLDVSGFVFSVKKWFTSKFWSWSLPIFLFAIYTSKTVKLASRYLLGWIIVIFVAR